MASVYHDSYERSNAVFAVSFPVFVIMTPEIVAPGEFSRNGNHQGTLFMPNADQRFAFWKKNRAPQSGDDRRSPGNFQNQYFVGLRGQSERVVLITRTEIFFWAKKYFKDQT
jgi:hypothetical protein